MAKKGIKIGMTPPHPGEFIYREVVEELGLTIAKTAEILGVSESDLTPVLKGKAPLSPEMALRVEKAFSVGMELMLRLQAWYDTVQMRKRADEIKVQPYNPAPAPPPSV